MRRVLVLLLLTRSAFADDRVDPPGADAKEKLHGDVLVWQDARLRLDPDDASTAIQLATLDGARGDSLGAVIAMHVVGTRGDLVEVEPAPSGDCVRHSVRAWNVEKLRLFVSRADLAPVLAKPFAQKFSDGSRVELRPGVAVIQTTGTDALAQLGLHELAAGGPWRDHEITLAIPAGSIAHSYSPSPVLGDERWREHVTVYAVDAGAPIAIGSTTWTAVPETMHATKHGDHELLEIADRCGTVVVSVAADRVHGHDTSTGGTIGGLFGSPPPPARYLPKGTPLSTTSGHRVAIAAEDVDATLEKDHACTDVMVGIDRVPRHGMERNTTVHLCAPASAYKDRYPIQKKRELPPEY